MLSLFFVAFMIGIVGSFHCVGMCGPLALSLPLSNNSFIRSEEHTSELQSQ